MTKELNVLFYALKSFYFILLFYKSRRCGLFTTLLDLQSFSGLPEWVDGVAGVGDGARVSCWAGDGCNWIDRCDGEPNGDGCNWIDRCDGEPNGDDGASIVVMSAGCAGVSFEVATRCVLLRLMMPLSVRTMKERGLWCFAKNFAWLVHVLDEHHVTGLQSWCLSLTAWRMLKLLLCFCFMFSSFGFRREWSGVFGSRWDGSIGTLVFKCLPIRSWLGDCPFCSGLAL